MNLTEFCSNSKELIKYLPEEDRGRQTDARVLGIKWDSQTDDTVRIFRSGKWEASGICLTKREVLQSIASVFDPLGLFQPVLLDAKLLLQQLWKRQVSWDDPIDSKLSNEWAEIQESIESLFKHR